MQGHFVAALALYIGQRRLVGAVNGIALGRTGEVDNSLGEGELSLGAAQALLYLPGIEAQAEGARVGVADIFACHAHDAPRQIQRIAASVQHPAKPIRGGVRGRASYSLVQGADLVIEQVSALVEAP